MIKRKVSLRMAREDKRKGNDVVNDMIWYSW